MSYLMYRPTERILEVIGNTYWEVWQGLPNLPFEDTDSRAGLSSLKHEEKGNYIWVTHGAKVAYEENPNTIFMAMMGKSGKGKIHAKWVTAAESTLDEAIQKAARLNREIIEEKIKNQKKNDVRR